MKRLGRILAIFSPIIFLAVDKADAQPVWVSGTPSVQAEGSFTLTLTFGIDRAGTVYFIVYNFDNASVQTSAFVKNSALTNPGGTIVSAGSLSVKKNDIGKTLQYLINVTNSGQIYTLYIVAADSKSRLQNSPVRLTATTLPCQVVNAGNGGNECGLSFALNAVSVFGTGTWTKVSGPGTASFSPNANSPGAIVTVSAYGSYTFRWTEIEGLCSSYGDVIVNFDQNISANAGNGGDECDKDFKLNAIPEGGTGTWSKVNGPGDAIFTPGANYPDALVTVSQYGNYDFAWTEINSNCSSVDVIRVVFHSPPAVEAGSDLAVCLGKSVQLSASGTGSFLWTPSKYLNNPVVFNPIATPDITTLYEVTLTDQWGCKNSDQVEVDVREKPEVNAGIDQSIGYIFETNLEANDLKSWETGEWSVLTGTGEFSDKNNSLTKVTGLSLGKNSFVWSVSNGICPISSDTVNILVNNLVIPTLITPNMDGKNDYFVLKGIESIGKTGLTIFNRWGGKVYYDNDYKNNWDGKDYSGNPLPDDTYFFILSPSEIKSISGYIIIKR